MTNDSHTRAGFRWVAERLFGLRYKEAHLSLSGLTKSVRALAVVGLALVAALLVLLLFPHLLPRQDQVAIGGAGGPSVPTALITLTLLVFPVAWAIIMWGASRAHPLMRVGIGLLYSVTYLWLGVPGHTEDQVPSGTIWAITLTRIMVFVPVGCLAVSAALAGIKRAPRLQTALGVIAALSAAAPFLFYLIARASIPQILTTRDVFTLRFAISMDIAAQVLVPLVFLATMSVVRLYYGVGEAIGSVATRIPRLPSRFLILVAIAAELWFLAWHERSLTWHGGGDAWRTVESIAVLGAAGVVVYVCRNIPRTPSELEVEHVRHYTALVAGAGSLLLFLFASGWGVVQALFPFSISPYIFFGNLTSIRGPVIAEWVAPSSFAPERGATVAELAQLALWLIVLSTALVIASRLSIDLRRRRVAIGFVVVALWGVVYALEARLRPNPLTPNLSLMAVVVAVTVGGWILIRWRKATSAELGFCAGLVILTWAVENQGHFFASLLGFAGIGSGVLLVVGIVHTIAGGSDFTRTDGRRFPRDARTLLWVGYLAISITISLWVFIVPAYRANVPSLNGYLIVGFAYASWLVMEGRFVLAADSRVAPAEDVASGGHQDDPAPAPSAARG